MLDMRWDLLPGIPDQEAPLWSMPGRALPGQHEEMGPAGLRDVLLHTSGVKLTSLEILHKVLAKHPEFLPEETSPTPNDIWMMNAYYQFCREASPETYSFSLPNALTGILHWRILGISSVAWGTFLGRLHSHSHCNCVSSTTAVAGGAYGPASTIKVPRVEATGGTHGSTCTASQTSTMTCITESSCPASGASGPANLALWDG